MADISTTPHRPASLDSGKDLKNLDPNATLQVLRVEEGAEPTVSPEVEHARRQFTYKEGERIKRRIDLIVMPLIMVVYLCKSIDVNNVSYIKTMNSGTSSNILKELKMTSDYYAYLSTVHTVAITLTELPSNLIMKWSTPRVHFLRIMIAWSIVACCHAAAKSGPGLLGARFILGLVEGGLYPGILLYLSSWYRPDELGVRFASVTVLSQFASVFQALITYGVSYMDGRGGLSGWRWVFLLEGLLGLVLAVAVYFWFPNDPETAWFLKPAEREFICARLPPTSPRRSDKIFDMAELKAAAKEPLTWVFSFIALFHDTASYGYNFWLPTIIASFGFTSGPRVQLLNIPPAVIYLCAGIGGNWLIDRAHKVPRPAVIMVGFAWACAMFICMAFVKSKASLYACVCLATIPGAFTYQSLMPWRSQTLKGSTHAAFTIGMYNAVAQLQGFYSAQIFRSQYAPEYTIPFMVCVAFDGAAIFLVAYGWYLTRHSEAETRRVAGIRRKEGREHNTVAQVEVVGIRDRVD
ncbi:hypothetical protein IAT38_004150 [Cryptococcus sp. DSM 104549]